MLCITDTNHLFEQTFSWDDYYCDCPNCKRSFRGKDEGYYIAEEFILIDDLNEDTDDEGYVYFCCKTCKDEYIEDLEGSGIEILEC